MKILLIAFFFAPLNKIASVRPSKLCKYWVRQGHDVTVLTGDNEEAYPLHDKLLLADELKRCRTVRTPYFSRTLLKKRLFPKAAIAPATQMPGKGGSPKPKNDIKSLLRPFLEWTRGFFSEENGSWYWLSRRSLRSMLKKEHFDLVVSSFGPMNCHWLGMYAKKLQKDTTWVADFRDPYSASDNIELSRYRQWLMENREARVYRRADFVTFVSKGISETIKEMKIDTPVRIITNGYDPEDLDRIASGSLFTEAKRFKLKIVYTGSIYPPMQDPAALFVALKELIASGSIEMSEIQLAYAGYHGQILLSFAQQSGLDGIVKDYGPISRNDSLLLQKSADVLLLITWNSRQRKGVLTGKFYEYMMSGKPVLAIINGDLADSETAQIINENEMGFVWEQAVSQNDTQLLQQFLINLIKSPDMQVTNDRPAGIEKYNYMNIAEQFIKLVSAKK